MPDLIPFAVIHIGVSIALAAMLAVAFAQSLLPFYPVLMICAALSLGGELSRRTARLLLAASVIRAILIGVYAWVRPGTHKAPRRL